MVYLIPLSIFVRNCDYQMLCHETAGGMVNSVDPTRLNLWSQSTRDSIMLVRRVNCSDLVRDYGDVLADTGLFILRSE